MPIDPTASSAQAVDSGLESQSLASDTKPLSPLELENEPHFSALLIGIDQFKSESISNLKEAISDAETVKTYLESILSVPSNSIRTLYNEEATRDAIIREFKELAKPRDRKGYPILIFFAGHGDTSELEDGSFTQSLIPHDCAANGVHGIPTRTVGALLEDIANARGDNITLILDCCYSGSRFRYPGLLAQSDDVRSVAIPDKLPTDIDIDIWSRYRYTGIPDRFMYSGIRSHVLLAACRAEETARDGYFTKALIEALRLVGSVKTTYTDIIKLIRPSLGFEQNPQCVGENRNRILFDARAPNHGPRTYPVHKKGGTYTLEAGSVHGIVERSEFCVYKDRHSQSVKLPIGTLKASKPNEFFTTMTVLSGCSELPADMTVLAVQIKSGSECCICIRIAPEIESIAKTALSIAGERGSEVLIEFVTSQDQAELDIKLEESTLVFDILDQKVTQYGLNRLPRRIPPLPEHLCPILLGIGHYYWHLRRTSNPSRLKEHIKVDLNTVIKQDTGDFDFVIRSNGPSLIGEGIADFIVDIKAMYGITIENTTHIDLYPSVFYFDSSDFSISPYFQPPVASKKVTAPLQAQQVLRIGYGGPLRSMPITYSLREGQDLDVGFIKIFLSTKPVDLAYIGQGSPFLYQSFDPKRVSRRVDLEDSILLWDTIVIPVVQRRKKVTEGVLNQ